METTPNTTNLQILDLPNSTLSERIAHSEQLKTLEAKRLAPSLDVPTLPHHIRDALRNINQPILLFGENPADVRNRLRLCLARIEIEKKYIQNEVGGGGTVEGLSNLHQLAGDMDNKLLMMSKKDDTIVEEVAYTHASKELISAREFISNYSFEKAKSRLIRERKRRVASRIRSLKRRHVDEKDLENDDDERLYHEMNALGPLLDYTPDDHHDNNSNDKCNNHNNNDKNDNAQKQYIQTAIHELDSMDTSCRMLYKSIHNLALEGSQFGDTRALSAICTCSCPNTTNTNHNNNNNPQSSSHHNMIATAGWSGTIQLWDSDVGLLNLGQKTMAHEDRITGIAMYGNMIATASIDRMGKLFKITTNDTIDKKDHEYLIEECAIFSGHEARLCSVAFHPSGKYVGTTSFDHTWRLWDVEYSSSQDSGGTTTTGGFKKQELLLQDGHWKEVYGIGFHPDGSLVSTTDYGSVVQVWDLRSGKSACHFLGHAKRVISTEFHPNGFQLATSGDDGTIKIWDLRQRKQYASIPAHSRLITQIKFGHDLYNQNGEFLVSASFDGTAKVWSTRDWKLLSTLRGHEGKVMGVDVVGDEGATIVTSGYDKTLKIWR